jgi:hypothetical protein
MTGAVWTDEQWAMFFDLLDKGWPGDLDPDGATAYQVLLDGTAPDEVVDALRRLLHQGARFRPSAAEILSARRRDVSRPTFDEAFVMIFGPRGVLRARPAVRRYADEAERRRVHDDAARRRAASMHPLLAAFVERQGLDRLRQMPVDAARTEHGPGDGHWARKELREAWERHVDAFDGREVAALASGGRIGLRQLDPLAALGAGTHTAALPAGNHDEEGRR